MSQSLIKKPFSSIEKFGIYIPLLFSLLILTIINPFVADLFHNNTTGGSLILFDLLIHIPLGVIGIKLAQKMKFPIWWSTPKDSNSSYFQLIVIGILVVGGNTLVTGGNGVNSIDVAPWLGALTPSTALLVSIRAGITEEILYRLFLVSFVAWMVQKLTPSKTVYLSVAIIATSLLFGLAHAGFNLAFFLAILLAVGYINYGLIPVMIIHFLADAVPFIYIALQVQKL